MKRDESRELGSARELLSEFESEMASPNAQAKLADALSFLAEIAEEAGPEQQIARNLSEVYAGKAAARANAVMELPGEIAPTELQHWVDVLGEFGRNGVESAPVLAAMAKLGKRRATRYVGRLTQAEQEVLLKRLEAEMGKEKP